MEVSHWSNFSKLLVTGASGFIGKAIVEQALNDGVPVHAAIRHRPLDLPAVEQSSVRIEDYSSLAPAFRGVSHVIHAAGLAHVFGKSQARSAPFTAVNEIGSSNVARAAVLAGVHHFVLISSVSVYGPLLPTPCEEDAPCHPSGPYAESKWRAEQKVAEILSHAGIPLTILRMATVYGEGDPGNVSRLIRAIDRGRFFWIGSCHNRKSLVHRDDAARACLAAVTAPSAGFRVFNVSAPPCRLRQIVETIAAALGKPTPRWKLAPYIALGLTTVLSKLAAGRDPLGSLPSLIRKWLSDDVYGSSLFERSFGFHTSVPIAVGLARQVAWYRGAARSVRERE